MLLRTSRQGRGYVGLCEHTGEPVEGRLVDVIPTKTSGWEKRMRTPRKRDSFTVGRHREQSCCLFNRFMFQFVFGWPSVCSGCLHWVEKIVSTLGGGGGDPNRAFTTVASDCHQTLNCLWG